MNRKLPSRDIYKELGNLAGVRVLFHLIRHVGSYANASHAAKHRQNSTLSSLQSSGGLVRKLGGRRMHLLV